MTEGSGVASAARWRDRSALPGGAQGWPRERDGRPNGDGDERTGESEVNVKMRNEWLGILARRKK